MERSEYIKKNMNRLFQLWLCRTLLLGVALFMVLSFMDYVAAPEHFYTFLSYRITISLLLIGFYLLARRLQSISLLYTVGLVVSATSAITIELMILKLSGHQSTYYVGMILLAVCVAAYFVAAPLRFHLISVLLVYSIYAVPILVTEKINDFPTFFTANSFLMTVFIAVLISSYFIGKLLIRNFGLQYDLDREKKKSERQFITFMKHLPGLAYVKNRDGVYIYTNENHKRLFGEWEGEKDSELHPPDIVENMVSTDRAVLTEGKTLETLTTTEYEDGVHYWMEYKFPIMDDNNNPYLIAGLAVDVSERKKFYDERFKAQKLEALGELTSGISHDFNNILAIILNNLELARMQGLENTSAYVERALDAVNRGRDMVGNLLNFSRGASAEPETVNLGKLVEETVNFMTKASDGKVKVDVDIMPGLWNVYINPSQLQQVIMNLYQNAKDAINGLEDAEIDKRNPFIMFNIDNIKVSGEYAKANSLVEEGEFVRLRVVDNGCGMDEETQSRIFEPFFSTKGMKNRGIGLSAVYGIVNQNGGWMDVESSPGVGTTFSIYLPKYAGESVLRRPSISEKVMGGSETILVVDDEGSLADSTAEMLENLGYNVLVAYSGEEALKLYCEKSGAIDLVIMDMVMPGLSGFELLERVRQVNPEARIIIASGNIAYSKYKIAGGSEGTTFLSKPFSPETLSTRVREALGVESGSKGVKQHLNRVKLYSVREKTVPYNENITNSRMIYKLFRHMAHEPREKFIAVFLDTQKRIIAYDELTQGTFNEAVVHSQEVIRTALLTNAAGVVLVHNHPSGNIEPSAQDLELTSRVVESCRMFNIEFLDHVIIGKGGYFSFSTDESH